MAPQVPPLDEQEYDSPLTLRELPGGTLNSDSIIWYFMSSPFFDAMNCINVALHRDLLRTPEEYILSNRQLCEERMRTKYPTGVQYVVVGEPQGEGQPWVIQRQNKVRNESSGGIDVLVEGTWYTQGTKILMAPSLLDIVQARLLSVSTRIQEMFELSKNLSRWSPATGHTYIPPSYEVSKATSASRMSSRLGTPALAAGDPDMAASSQTQSQVPGAGSADPGATTTQFSDDLFMASLRLTNRFGHEYMDENPLQGEPGSFVFTNTNAAVDARHKAQAQAAEAAAASQNSSSSQNHPGAPAAKTESQSTAPSVAPTPKGIATPAAAMASAEAQSRKGSVASLPKGVKEKRRKSKGLTSPTTPTVPS